MGTTVSGGKPLKSVPGFFLGGRGLSAKIEFFYKGRFGDFEFL